jgi:ADP-heptose:LPS heptosyltransferase
MLRRLKALLLRRLCGQPRTQHLNKATLRSFILLRYDRIGDLIVSLPLAKALKNKYPTAKLAIIASQSNAPVAVESGLFSTVHVKPRNHFMWIRLLIRLRGQFDVVVDLNHAVAPHAIFATLIIGPKHVASPFKEGRWGVQGTDLQMFDIMPANGDLNRPMMEIYLDIARQLDCQTKRCTPYPLGSPKTTKQLRRPLLLLNHEGSGSRKRISNHDLVSIAALASKLKPQLQIIMTPMPESHDEISALMEDAPNVSVLPPSQSISEVIAVAKLADLIVTPDTSLVHIACAFSRPLIAVYASHPVFFKQWQPINTATTHIVFSKDLKTLNGYSSEELLRYCHEMIKAM